MVTIPRLSSAAAQAAKLKKTCFFAFAIVRCCKKAFTQADEALEIQRFYKHGH